MRRGPNNYGIETEASVNLPQKIVQELQVPQPEEVEAILKEVEGKKEWSAFVLATDCGMRRSEIVGLTWETIDLEKKQIHVREALVTDEHGVEHRKTTETTAGPRVLVMTNRVYTHFLNADKCHPPITASLSQLTSSFYRINKKLGYNYHLHSFRHYFASTCAALGIPKPYTIKLMGHANQDMIHRVYVHTH